MDFSSAVFFTLFFPDFPLLVNPNHRHQYPNQLSGWNRLLHRHPLRAQHAHLNEKSDPEAAYLNIVLIHFALFL